MEINGLCCFEKLMIQLLIHLGKGDTEKKSCSRIIALRVGEMNECMACARGVGVRNSIQIIIVENLIIIVNMNFCKQMVPYGMQRKTEFQYFNPQEIIAK